MMKAREMMAWVLLIVASLLGGKCYVDRQGMAEQVEEMRRRADDVYAEQREDQRDRYVEEYTRLTGGKPYPKSD